MSECTACHEGPSVPCPVGECWDCAHLCACRRDWPVAYGCPAAAWAEARRADERWHPDPDRAMVRAWLAGEAVS